MGMKSINIPKEQLLKLRQEGVRIVKIARLYKCTPQTVRNYLKAYGIYSKDKTIRLDRGTSDVLGWDKPAELTEDDKKFLERYNLSEYMK